MTSSNRFDQATPIVPSFPNWNKSFVSGSNSTLFETDHRIARDPLELISKVKFKSSSEGPPGHVHGGASAALIDEVMGILIWNENMPAVTQELNLKYWKPVPMNAEAEIITTITLIQEKTVTLKSTLFCNKKTPCIEAIGVFYKISDQKLEQFLTRATK